MASRFVIMEDRNATGAQRFEVLHDGWSFFAFLFPVIWALWNRLWLTALLILAAMTVLGLIASDPVMVVPAYMAMLLVSAWIALESGQWRVAAFARQGYQPVGAVMAETREDAELIWAHRMTAVEGENGRTPETSAGLSHPRLQPRRRNADIMFGSTRGKQ